MEYYKLSDARLTENKLYGESYTIDYIRKQGMMSKWWSYTQKCAWIPEFAEVLENENGEITFSIHRNESPYHTYPTEFKTRKGTFITDDRGEFGGRLILPNKTEIYGNYFLVFEHNRMVYAIDSLSHFGCQHLKIIKFGNSYFFTVYSTRDCKSNDEFDNISFKTIYQDKENVYILASGFNLLNDDSYSLTKLFVIDSNNNLSIIAQYNRFYGFVKNMIIRDNKMYLGLDKCVSVTDLKNGEEKFYTFLSEDAEANILEANRLE